MSARSPRPNVPGTLVEHRGAPWRTRPTTGHLGPRDPGPHGITLTLRESAADQAPRRAAVTPAIARRLLRALRAPQAHHA